MRVTTPNDPVRTEHETHWPGEPAQAETTQETTQEETQAPKQTPWYIEIPAVVIFTLALMFVIQTFLGRLYVIPSASMEPTLHGESGSGDRILVQKVS